MIEFKIGKTTVEVHNDINQLSMNRLSAFNRYSMLDAGIGSNIQEADETHFNKIFEFIAIGDTEGTLKQVQALRKAIALTISEVNPEFISFACLIAKIGDKQYNDMSESGLGKVQEHLKKIGLTVDVLRAHREDVKKNSTLS